MLLTTDRSGYLLSPHWPVWSEALGFMRWSKEDSPGRNGWLRSAGADIRMITGAHLRSVFDFREGVRKWFQGKHIAGVWAPRNPHKVKH